MKKIKKVINKKRKRIIPGPKERITEQRAIFSSIGDHIMAVVVVDKNGKIMRTNEAFGALTGWREKEVIGKSLVRVIPREDENRNRVPFKKRILSRVLSGTILTNTATIAAGGIEKLPTFYYVRKNKSRFPASSVISPIMLKGRVSGAIEVFYDITKEKELERIRMDFLSLASHQLRTPLSGAKWLIETMYKGVIGEITKKQKEYIDAIYKINEQMIRLVSDILNALRLETEEALVKKEKISVQSLFKDVLSLLTPVAESKKITLQSPLNHRTFTIKTDPEILKSIIRCFLSNAIDYSMPGQKVILGIKKEPEAVVFYVRDFGAGIPRNEQKRIFERFYRSSNAKRLKPNGTGLGLSIAKVLAEKIDSEISFESKANKGSTFYLRIPKKSSRDAKVRSKT